MAWEKTFRKGEDTAHLRLSLIQRQKCSWKIHSNTNSILSLEEISKHIEYISYKLVKQSLNTHGQISQMFSYVSTALE